jgi:hypothetical protein
MGVPKYPVAPLAAGEMDLSDLLQRERETAHVTVVSGQDRLIAASTPRSKHLQRRWPTA